MNDVTTGLSVGIVAPAPVPEVFGGAERLWRSLATGLEAAGHRAEIVTLPFPERDVHEVLDGYERFGALDVSRFDVVISGKYPAWMITHPCHLVYMLHPLRGLYDTYPDGLADLGASTGGEQLASQIATASNAADVIRIGREALADLGPTNPLCAYPGPLARALVHRLDQLAFAPDRVGAFAAISEEVAGRAHYFPSDRAVQVVHPVSDLPDQQPSLPTDADSADLDLNGPVFFTASRHDTPKRIDLIIAAFRHLTDGHNDRQLSLLIAGDGPERDALETAAGANERIHFLGRVSEKELAYRYAASDAVVFVPEREDFGYISLEAMMAGTPVLTTTDAGGANELLDEGVGGIVVEPTVAALADAMDDLADHPHRRWQLGLNGQRRAALASWDPLVQTVVDVAGGRSASAAARPTTVVVSTFGVDPMVGGGQRRLRHLARALARRADVTVLALTNDPPLTAGQAVSRRVLEPGLTQIAVSRSEPHRRAQDEITRVAGFPVDDITCGRLWPANPEFGDELRRLVASNDIVVNAHPFLAPAVSDALASLSDPDAAPVVVYDAHNAETSFKASVLRAGSASVAGADWLIDAVREAETAAVSAANYVSACTKEDLDDVVALVPQTERPTSTAVVGNGVDTAAMAHRTDHEYRTARLEALALLGAPTTEERPLAVFIGSWHPPNIEAARLAVELARDRPDWIIGLAGSHTLAFNSVLSSSNALPENVRTLPAFAEESLWPLLAGADVALNPMVSGGGSNLKLFDYLAVGVPVLTTATGSRGLDAPDDVVWTADEATAASLSAVLDELTNNDTERSRRSENGRALAESTVDWRDLGARWADDILAFVPTDLGGLAPRPHPVVGRPQLASDAPPPPSPTIELMNRLADNAVHSDPPPETTMLNPNLRENLRRMRANRHAGQVLPADARLKLAKSAVLRVNQAITNEQATFNEATVDAVSQLSEHVAELQTELDAQTARIAELEAELAEERKPS